MKRKLFVTSLAVLLATGCATRSDKPVAWEVKPTVQVRHGMVDAMAFYQLGRHHQNQGQVAAAEEAYVKAIAADPKHADALNALGMIYAERGELERAAAAFKRVTELAPEKAYLYNNIGYALFLDGRHQEAVDALSKAVTLNPGYERAWVNLRAVAEKAGLTTLAALAAERRLPPRESQAPRNAAGATAIAATPDSPEEPRSSPDLRLAVTPTLKVLTEPTVQLAVEVAPEPAAVAEAPARTSVQLQPVQPAEPLQPVAATPAIQPPIAMAPVAIAESEKPHAVTIPAAAAPAPATQPVVTASRAEPAPAVPAITLTEVPYKMVALAPALEPVVLAVASDVPFRPAAEVRTDAPMLSISASPESPVAKSAPQAHGRIEVSNGNGVTGFATRVGKQLRKEGARVSRITNHGSYKVEQSFIEYRSDWNTAAQALRDRLGQHIAIQEAKVERKGTDIRVVLGRDSVQQVATLMKPKPHQGKATPLLLTRNDR